MRAFGIGLPLAAELRRGDWNVLLWARLGDACLLSQPPVSGPRPAIPAGVTNLAIRAYSMCASPIAIPKEYVELRNNDAYPAIIDQNN